MENTTPVSSRSSGKKNLFLLLGLLIILVGFGAWYMQAVPVRLIGLKIFEGEYLGGKLFSFGITGLREKAVPVSGTLADYAAVKGTAVAIVRNAETKAADVMLISSKSRALTTDGGGKAALALSSDGTMVAYAALTAAPEGADFSVQLSAWSIKLVDVKTGEMTLLGTGFAPEFFMAGGKLMLMFTGPTGITIADVAAKTSQTTFFLNPGVIDYAAHVSDDGKYVAIPNGLTKHYDFFTVTHVAAPLGISPLGSATPVLVHGDFEGPVFYGIAREPSAVPHLWKFDMTKPPAGEELFTLPNSALYRFVP